MQFVNMRYFEGATFTEIANAMHYSEDHVRKNISKDALAALEEILTA